MENSWIEYLAKRLLEDAGANQLDRDDPAVQAILQNPDMLAAFTKNPANATRNQKDARQITQKAITTNKSLPLVAVAQNVARKGGLS